MTFNTALKACGNAGRLDQALRVYAALVSRGVRPSVTTFALLLAAAAAADSPQTVRMVRSLVFISGLPSQRTYCDRMLRPLTISTMPRATSVI